MRLNLRKIQPDSLCERPYRPTDFLCHLPCRPTTPPYRAPHSACDVRTEIAYGATRQGDSTSARSSRTPLSVPSLLPELRPIVCTAYAGSQNEIHDHIALRKSGTDIAYAATRTARLRRAVEVPHPGIAYKKPHFQYNLYQECLQFMSGVCDVRYCHRVSCGVGGLRCAVLG
eukprot:3230951-Rhodomonas_salina.1